MSWMRIFTVTFFFLLSASSPLLANGGAWQMGVPVTGNAAATDQKKSTNVTIEDEKLVIDLHQEFAAAEVRYRMRNTGAQVEQDFFFPVERWAESDGETSDHMVLDLEGYAITADGAELKWQDVDAKGEQPKPTKGAPNLPTWNKGALLEVALGRAGSRDTSFRLIPVTLDARGFPHSGSDERATAAGGTLSR